MTVRGTSEVVFGTPKGMFGDHNDRFLDKGDGGGGGGGLSDYQQSRFINESTLVAYLMDAGHKEPKEKQIRYRPENKSTVCK